MIPGHEWISCNVVHRVVFDILPKRDCTGANARILLMGIVSGSLLTPAEPLLAAFLHIS